MVIGPELKDGRRHGRGLGRHLRSGNTACPRGANWLRTRKLYVDLVGLSNPRQHGSVGGLGRSGRYQAACLDVSRHPGVATRLLPSASVSNGSVGRRRSPPAQTSGLLAAAISIEPLVSFYCPVERGLPGEVDPGFYSHSRRLLHFPRSANESGQFRPGIFTLHPTSERARRLRQPRRRE